MAPQAAVLPSHHLGLGRWGSSACKTSSARSRAPETWRSDLPEGRRQVVMQPDYEQPCLVNNLFEAIRAGEDACMCTVCSACAELHFFPPMK